MVSFGHKKLTNFQLRLLSRVKPCQTPPKGNPQKYGSDLTHLRFLSTLDKVERSLMIMLKRVKTLNTILQISQKWHTQFSFRLPFFVGALYSLAKMSVMTKFKVIWWNSCSHISGPTSPLAIFKPFFGGLKSWAQKCSLSVFKRNTFLVN